MATRRTDSPTMVSLPSIQEMFPEYLLDRPSARNIRHSSHNGGLELSPPVSSHLPPPRQPQQAGYDEHAAQSISPEPSNSRRAYVYPSRPVERKTTFGPLQPRSPVGGQHRTLSMQEGERSSPGRVLQIKEPGRHATPPYSYNVLRCDPLTSSGSETHLFESDPVRYAHHKGTSPSFRVNLAPSAISAPSHFGPQYPRSQEADRQAAGTPRSFPTGSQTSILSFSVSRGPSGSAPLTFVGAGGREVEDNTAFSDDGAEADQNWKVKRHQCPHCTKRFNRPSSLRIHVNTHTGARPFQCPHPNCGREFNVNSNMRRHYRNHVRPGPSQFRRSTSPSHLRSSAKRRAIPLPSQPPIRGQAIGHLERSPRQSASSEHSGDDIYDGDGPGGMSDDEEEDQLIDDGDDVRLEENHPVNGYPSSNSASPPPSASSALRPRSAYTYPLRGDERTIGSRVHESSPHSHSNIQIRSPPESTRSNSPCKYTASSMYRAVADNVSTTLRPAFPVRPVGSSSEASKDESNW